MANCQWLQIFHSGSLTHGLVVAMVIGIAGVTTWLGRRSTTGTPVFTSRLTAVLYGVSLIVFLRDLRPDRMGWDNSLPLHICDITGLMAALALQTRRRFARCILHYWGLGLSSQAFLFPVLQAGPIHTDFWLYWIEHGAIVIAAVYDITVNGYRPDWRDWRMATLALAGYAAAIAPIDALFDLNYGYLGQTASARRSMIAIFGPWPQRVPALWLAGVGLMSLLRLRWPTWRVSHSASLMLNRDSLLGFLRDGGKCLPERSMTQRL